MPNNQLTSLIRRLEAATSRLEDIALSVPGFDVANTTGSTARQPNVSDGDQEKNVAENAGQSNLPPILRDFETLSTTHLDAYLEAGKDLDQTITEQAVALATAFKCQRNYLTMTTKAKKPDMNSPSFAELISSMQHALGEVNDIKDSHRGSQYRDHLAMVSEGTGALYWLFEEKPVEYLTEVIGGIQLFGNRIMKDYKDKDPKHVNYVKKYVSLWKALQDYVKQYCSSGIKWNENGLDLEAALKNDIQAPSKQSTPQIIESAASTPPSPLPPPPPPPPLPTFSIPTPTLGSFPVPPTKSGGDMSAVFEQLNQGESVTAGLKKVDKSQMTHKNPALRAGNTEPDRRLSVDSIGSQKSKGPAAKPKPESMRSKSSSGKEGRKALDGNKWIIESFDNPASPIELELSMVQSVLITKCKNTTIILKGKGNAVSIDNSSRTNLILDNLVSSVDVVKCPNFALQVTGSLPTIMLDQVDGASIYLSRESLHTEVYTSKCTSININVPPENQEDDFKECPIPEQIRTFIKGGALVSEIVEHSG